MNLMEYLDVNNKDKKFGFVFKVKDFYICFKQNLKF